MRTIAVAILLCCTSATLDGQTHSAATFILSRQVPFFDVKQRNLIDALLSFGQQEHIAIGIEYIDKAAFQQQMKVDEWVGTRLRVLGTKNKIRPHQLRTKLN